jgi:predicted nucleotidyltransferase
MESKLTKPDPFFQQTAVTAPSLRDDRHLLRILAVLREALADTECRVYLFGSRATGQHHGASDFDIAVETSVEVSRRLGVARDLLVGSNIPFSVDLVELSAAPEALQRRVLEQGILLWSN